MKYIVSASEMKQYDLNTIEKTGIPAYVLMERAALAAVEAVEAHCVGLQGRKSVLVMAGMGNNGGDGLAAARLLREKGYTVEVWCVGNAEHASAMWRLQMEILKKYPVSFVEEPDRQEYTVMIDALFGVGLSREISGKYAQAVERFCRTEGWKLALDLPSGIDCDTGRVWGCAVKAHKTVTFGFWKRGLVLYPGCGYAGEVIAADIGISPISFYGREPEMYAYDQEPGTLLPERRADGHKGTFGRVLLAAGSENMAGAAVLAAKAAYRAGAGMVKVVTPAVNRVILLCAVPEALTGTPETLERDMEWADVLAVGPGLGQDERALLCLERMIKEGKKPLVIDADGLNLLAVYRELRELLAQQGAKGRKIVLTPHVGELSRLAGITAEECSRDLLNQGRKLAGQLHAAVAAKDARTFVIAENCPVCVNLSGNSGMAAAGSGDVLTGLIAGLLAQGMETFKAAAAGVYLHGRAGDRAAAKRGEHGCMAGDIAEQIGI